MSPVQRPLTDPIMFIQPERELQQLRQDESYVRSGRLGRTLARSGRLRVTLVALNAGIEVGTHHADSPMTIQILEGRISFRVADQVHEMSAGEVLFFGPGDAHDIRAVQESALLLTISAIGDDA